METFLEPLFDKRANFVGWLYNREHIFDTDLNWVAYINNGYAWSVKKLNWIGKLKNTNCLDRDGKVVAWNPDSPVIGGLSEVEEPLKSYKPLPPPKPLISEKPLKPPKAPKAIGGWSPLTFSQWLDQ
ncbi:4-fold beta flower protein [Clostridium algidicarnis]|uniref:4-fold beta flower protein n=1 Tax=Clostridium algidicarnis TaxID=37659 RepID=UPI001C0AEA8F|nr:hypothetical protein [Clostridium algidicarnis]MBU3209463.1 hypothetical protein [Clostridium algidicarnis]MBU3227282.1 hypothetical protein [Clostridium algidicarnis]MBU3250806.1 hypothetical protein [Clostridium algidicarnis]